MTSTAEYRNASVSASEPDIDRIKAIFEIDDAHILTGAAARGVAWANRRNVIRRILNRFARKATSTIWAGSGRPREHSEEYYEEVFSHNNMSVAAQEYLETYNRPLDQKYYRLADGRYVLSDSRRVHVLTDAIRHQIIAELAPRTLCEVGSGNGRNLFTIAGRFPDLALTGYEVTENGTRLARAMQSQDMSRTAFGQMFDIGACVQDAIRRISFETASAFSLPCADNTFDVAITSAAISCMSDQVSDALREIHRVTRGHIILYEPFNDVNTPLGRLFLRTNKDVSLTVNDVSKQGFEVVSLIRNIPAMPTHAYGLLLAKVVKP